MRARAVSGGQAASGKARLPGNTPAPERKIAAAEIARRITLAGHVQGVGFRPFVFRLAHRLGLAGRVWNAVGAVEIEIQGPEPAVSRFVAAVISDAPPLARPRLLRCEPLAVQPSPPAFSIEASSTEGTPQIFVPADQFACDDCLAELADPHNRRYRYPFILEDEAQDSSMTQERILSLLSGSRAERRMTLSDNEGEAADEARLTDDPALRLRSSESTRRSAQREEFAMTSCLFRDTRSVHKICKEAIGRFNRSTCHAFALRDGDRIIGQNIRAEGYTGG